MTADETAFAAVIGSQQLVLVAINRHAPLSAPSSLRFRFLAL
jgi:hypothetical protein